jgi:AcrR family transcriptional regulator
LAPTSLGRVSEAESTKFGRKEEILRVAAGVIAERGFYSATVRDIAEAAGILSGSLYHHFKSKDEILIEILRSMVERTQSSYRDIAAGKNPPEDSVRALVMLGFDVLDTWQTELTILQNDFALLERFDDFAFIVEAQNEIADIWRNEIERGKAARVFSADIDSRVAYRAIMGSILSASRWYRKSQGLSAAEVGRQHADLFLYGLKRP